MSRLDARVRMGVASALRMTVLVGMLVSLAGGAGAQTVFALRNVGQPLATEDARMIARGGWGMAVTDSMHPGFKNLASLAAIKHVALSFTGYGERSKNSDQRGDRKTSRTVSPDVRVALPVVKERFALTAGFQIYRSNQYTTRIDTLFGEVWSDSVSGSIQFRREGNRFRVPLGASWRVLPGLSVSGAFNLERGSIREELTHRYDFPNLGLDGFGDIIPVYLADLKEVRDEYSGESYTVGFLLNPFDRLQLGGSWTPAHDIDVNRKITHLGVSARSTSAFVLRQPDEFMAGVQLGVAGRWRLGADARVQKYSEFTGYPDWEDEMEDEYGFAVGVERKRGHVRRGGAKNLPLRAGYARQQWGYRVGGATINEEVYSLGTGFPFRGNLGQLDLALSYGRIGDMATNRMKSDYWRVTISVTGLERWW